MASLGSLIITMAVDTARFQGDLGRAATIAESRMRNIRDTARRTVAQLTAIGTAAGAAITLAVKAAIDRADDMRDLAQGAGVSVEAMSRLAYAAKQSGTEVSVVAKALAKLAKNGAADPQRALEDLADQFVALPDGAEKTALAIEIFGEKIGPQLVPLLNEGKIGLRQFADEADRLRITIGTAAANAADEFNDRMGKLRETLNGLSNNLAAEMLPILNAFTQEMADAATSAQNLDRFARQLSTGFKILVDVAYSVYKTFDDIGTAIGALAAAAVAVAKGNFAEAAEIIRAANEDQIRSEAAANQFLVRLWSERAEAAENAARRIARSNLEAVSRGNDPVLNRARTKFDPKEGKSKATSDVMDGLSEINVWQREIYNLSNEQQKLFSDLSYAINNDVRAAVQDLTNDTLRMKMVIEESAQPFNQLSAFAEQAARNMQDSFAQFLYNPFKDGLRGMLAGFTDMLRQMLAQLAAQEILRAFFGWMGGLGGAVGSFGTAAAGGLSGTRASGGPVSAGGAYLVGERGPELLMMGNRSGTVIPGGGWGGVTVAPVYNIDARGATSDLVKMLPAILEETSRRTVERTKAELRGDIRRYGRLR